MKQMKWNRTNQIGNNRDAGFTLIWVLMLGIVLVTTAAAVIYAVSYGSNHGTRTLQKDIQFGATQGEIASVIKLINATMNGGSLASDTPAQAAAALAQQITGTGSPTLTAQYMAPPFTDSSGNTHVVLQVTEANGTGNPGLVQLNVMFPTGTNNNPPSAGTDPYWPSNPQDVGMYIYDNQTTTQNTITSDESSHTGTYIIVNGSSPTSSQQLVVSGQSLTYGATGNMAELVTNGVALQNGANVTVDGALDTGSGNVTLDSSGALTVTGQMISNSITLNSNSSLQVDGQLTVNTLNVNSGAQITVNGKLYVAGELQINSNSPVTVGGSSTISDGLVINSNSTLTIAGNLSESSSIQLNSGANLIVDDNADINGSIVLNSNSALTVNQNMCVNGTPGSLTINSNGTVTVGKQALVTGGYSGSASDFHYGTYVTSGTCPENSSSGSGSGGSVTEQ